MSSIQQRPTSHWRVIASPEGGKKWAVSKRKLPMSPSFQKLPSGMDDIEQKYDAYKGRIHLKRRVARADLSICVDAKRACAAEMPNELRRVLFFRGKVDAEAVRREIEGTSPDSGPRAAVRDGEGSTREAET